MSNNNDNKRLQKPEIYKTFRYSVLAQSLFSIANRVQNPMLEYISK